MSQSVSNRVAGRRWRRIHVSASIIVASVAWFMATSVLAQADDADAVSDPFAKRPAAAGKPSAGKTTPAKAGQGDHSAKLEEAAKLAEKELAAKESEMPGQVKESSGSGRPQMPDVDWLWLLTIGGGPLMVPIWGISVLVVTLVFERLFALRRGKAIPRKLLSGLKALNHPERGTDPRQAYALCRRFSGSAVSVIRVMLLNCERPRVETEQMVREASQREADRLNTRVRWFTLAAAIEPMLGLLGTVQGMIMAFYITSHLPSGANRGAFLAESIYIALVTTFGGLTVAIPSAIFGHFFAGKILKLFREIDEVVSSLATQVERFQRKQAKEAQRTGRPEMATPPPVVSDAVRSSRPGVIS